MLILGIESSCDETAAAILADGKTVLSDVIDSQVQVHRRYGGVVPELASRRHIEAIHPVVRAALDSAAVSLDDIDAVAVTQGPGLVGCLLVGFSFGKALALAKKIPCVGVNHMAGHIVSVFLGDSKPDFPFVALVASGGHSSLFVVTDPLTFRLLGQSRDDAAGEAFDKVAKVLGLGYPGGPIISDLARAGNPNAIAFPRAWLEPQGFDFSFSGLKTAVVNHVRQQGAEKQPAKMEDICASFQEAVVEVLVEKAIMAAQRFGAGRVALAGGVAANERLREVMRQRTAQEGIEVFMPKMRFCTDNAAMIALAGYHKVQRQGGQDLDLDVYSRSEFHDGLLMV